MRVLVVLSFVSIGVFMAGLSASGAHAAPLANSAIKSQMNTQGCFACHAANMKIVGPAYGWVAYRFAHQKGAVQKLAHKIITGGAGEWNAWTGGIAMPPHPNLSLAQAEAMARWVLAQKPIAPPPPG
ncbi:MAG: c-type cytochrome [Gammaproteobacteria bacterium]